MLLHQCGAARRRRSRSTYYGTASAAPMKHAPSSSARPARCLAALLALACMSVTRTVALSSPLVFVHVPKAAGSSLSMVFGSLLAELNCSRDALHAPPPAGAPPLPESAHEPPQAGAPCVWAHTFAGPDQDDREAFGKALAGSFPRPMRVDVLLGVLGRKRPGPSMTHQRGGSRGSGEMGRRLVAQTAFAGTHLTLAVDVHIGGRPAAGVTEWKPPSLPPASLHPCIARPLRPPNPRSQPLWRVPPHEQQPTRPLHVYDCAAPPAAAHPQPLLIHQAQGA